MSRAFRKVMGPGVVVLLLVLPGAARAQGIPVLDIQGLLQAIIEGERTLAQLDQLARQYEKQIEELSVAIEQRDALLGARGLGRLLNGESERRARRGLPGTLDELLRIAESGEAPSLQDLRRLYALRQEELELAQPRELGQRGESGRTSRTYDRARRSTLASLAVSEKAYDDAALRVGAYERLIDEIDRAGDLKASTDLANRIEAENGLTLNALVQLQAMSMATSSSARANELAGRSNLSEFSSFDPDAFDALARSLRVGGDR